MRPWVVLSAIGLSWAQTAWAQDQGAAPESPDVAKQILVDFARSEPMDSNVRFYFSLNQLFGEGSRRLGQAGGDDHLGGRIGQFLVLAYLNLAIGHYTHELVPFAYLDLRRAPLYAEGVFLGLRARMGIGGHLGVTGRIEHSARDVVENAVKVKPEGFRAVLGVSWTFSGSRPHGG
jgi:hypothetical protein